MYILDADTFITSNNQHYGLDFFPGYWRWLISAHKRGLVFSTTDIRAQINKEGTQEQKDLKLWCGKGNVGAVIFEDPTRKQSHEEQISSWVRDKKRPYSKAARDQFIRDVDFLLIAEALSRQAIVVSYEGTGNPQDATLEKPQKRIKIPDVCMGLGIQCIQPFEMLRREQPGFVWLNGD